MMIKPEIRKFVIWTVVGTVGLLAIGATGAGIYASVYISRIEAGLPPLEKLLKYEPAVPSSVLSRDGVKIGELFDEKRYPAKLSEISPLLVKAFMAAEDARFYEHDGVDYQGIMRAGMHYFLKSGPKQGGSTITQQLAKNVLLSKERTVERKLKDILLARRIEKELKKDQILELYLNTIFLGNNSYGAEAAARNYFRKAASKLTLAEAALIAGLAPAPSAYAPTESFEKAKVRQKFVLDQMVRNKWATAQEAEEAFKQKLKIHVAESPNTTMAPYFFMEVKKQLEGELKIANLTSGGYTIHTTLDMKLQRKVTAAVEEGLRTHEGKKGFRGAIKRHGPGFEAALKQMLSAPTNPDAEDERAIVVDLFPHLDAVGIVSQHGLGILLAEDHRWALRAGGRKKEGSVQDFANILAIGDEVHVKMLERGSPRRIVKNAKDLEGLSAFTKYYPQTPGHEGARFYALTDTEGVEAAALVMDARQGDVLAMVGGESFMNNQFNHATQAKRQVGSSVKPLYYTLALDKGFSPASKIDSPPIVIGDWKPENYSKEFTGRTTMRTSLIHSYNISSIQLFQAMGIGPVSQWFRRLGLAWPEADLSLALGAGDATLLEMIQAYSPFANEGRLTEAIYITKIEDRHGKVLFERGNPVLKVEPIGALPKTAAADKTSGKNGKGVAMKAKDPRDNSPEGDPLQIYTPEAAFVGMRMMQDVMRFGTGTRAAGVPQASGKTGTTNGYTDAWFLGVTPQLVGGVWVGFDDARKSLGSEGTGGKMAAPIWRTVMLAAHDHYPSKAWATPRNVHSVRVNPETGDLVAGGGGITMPVIVGTEPGVGRNALGMYGMSGTEEGGEQKPEAESSDTSSLRSVY